MRRLLFIPLDYDKIPRPHEDWLDAFGRCFDVEYFTGWIFDTNKYDYIFAQSGAILPDNLLGLKNTTGATVMQWTGDCREHLLENVTAYKGVADLTFLAAGVAQKEMYETALGHRVEYLQHAVAPWQFLPVKEMTEGKTVFIGNNYGEFPGAVERTDLCKMISATFENVEIIGSGFASHEFVNNRSVPYEQTAAIYNNAYIGISANIYNDKPLYYSNRPLDIMAAGCCCLMRYVPGIETQFTDGEHCVFYRSNDEAMDKIAMLNADPERRNRIAKAGQEQVRKFHTYDYRVTEILKHL